MTETLPDGVFIPPERRADQLTVRLTRPVRHGERELSEVALGPLKALHVRQAPRDAQESEGLFDLAGRLSGLPPSVLDQLVGEDVGNVLQATLTVSWPMLDLPVQWEEVWRLEAERASTPRRRLPEYRGGYELALVRPLRAERDTLSLLRFSELTGRVARRCPPDVLPTSKLPWLVEELTGAPRAAVDELTGLDLNRALALAQLFFLAIRGTSATSG
jgi:hypothetical protein